MRDYYIELDKSGNFGNSEGNIFWVMIDEGLVVTSVRPRIFRTENECKELVLKLNNLGYRCEIKKYELE